MSRLILGLSLVITAMGASLAHADPIYPVFLGSPSAASDLTGTSLSVCYSVFDSTGGTGNAGIGELLIGSTTYSGGLLGTPSVQVTNFNYTLKAFFNLQNGTLSTVDASTISVSGTIAKPPSSLSFLSSGQQTFYSSNTLSQFGRSSDGQMFQFTFTNSGGTIDLHGPIFSLVTSGTLYTGSYSGTGTTVSDPKFAQTDASNGTVLWGNDFKYIVPSGSSNTWAPTPLAASGGVVLLGILGAGKVMRRKGIPRS